MKTIALALASPNGLMVATPSTVAQGTTTVTATINGVAGSATLSVN